MAAISNELKSNLLSNIVFLDILLYHNRLKQSSLFSPLTREIPGTIPVHQNKKSAVQKIIIKELRLSVQNLPSLLLLYRTPVLGIYINIYNILYIFVISNNDEFLKEFIARRHSGMIQNYQAVMQFPGIASKIKHFHICRSLNYERCVNIGEPAAVFVFLPETKVVELIVTEYTAAGLLFCSELRSFSIVNCQLFNEYNAYFLASKTCEDTRRDANKKWINKIRRTT